MKRKFRALVPAVCLMALLLTGCGRMTAEKLVVKLARALAERPVTQAQVLAEMDMSAGVEWLGIAVETELGLRCQMETVISADPYRACGDGELNLAMTLFGRNIDLKEPLQIYSSVENGELVSYTHTEKPDLWLKQQISLPETGGELQEAAARLPISSYGFLADKLTEELTLEEETALLNDREVYVLRCTLSGEEVQQVLSAVGYGNALADLGLEGVDLTVLRIPAVFYVNADTFLPAKMELDIQGTDEMVAPLVGKLLEGSGFDLKVNIRSVRITLSDIGFDPVEVPAVPEEAKQ